MTDMNNWKKEKLGDVCEFYNGKAHEKSIDKNGKYKVVNSKFVSSNGEKAKRTDNAQFPLFKDDIVMVMSDVPNGKTLAKCFLIDKEDTYTLNQRVCAIRTNNFDKQFLYYQLNRNKYLLDFNNGENQTNLRKDDILNCELLIPPLREQQRIVVILDEAFAAIAKAKANAEQNLKNAKDLFESYLQNVFETKGDGWVENKLGEVCELINRGVSPKYLEKNGIIVLNQKCIRDHKISFEQSRFHDGITKKVNPEKMIKLGDVLINSTGTGTLGRVAQVREELENVTVDSHVTIVRPVPDLFFIDFFGWALIFIEDEIAKRGDGCGGQTELARTTLKNDFTICFPKSLKEQQTIVQKLDALSIETKKLEAIYQQKIADLEELKKSVLQKAFSGGLKEKLVTT